MLYKENRDTAKSNMNAWWDGEDIGRPALQLTAPRVGHPHPFSGWMLVNNLDKIDYVASEFEKHCRDRWFGCEAFPSLWLNFGPGIPAAYLCIEPRITDDTVWFEPDHPMGWDEILALRFDEKNRWWQATLNAARELVKLGKGKFLIGNTDLNAEMNILAHIRNNRKLLLDLLDCPQNVVEMDKRIHAMWMKCYDALTEILMPHNEGTIWWMGIWCSQRATDTQSDFSAMISPAMFKKFVMPDLVDTSRRIPRTIYHWDGPGEIPHLDHLLSIKELTGIQWIPGAGQPDCGDPKWFPYYKKIQAAGKRLVLQQHDNPKDLKRLLENVSRKGLLLRYDCKSIDEGKRIIKNAEKWSKA